MTASRRRPNISDHRVKTSKQFDAAVDKYITAAVTGFDPADAAAAWGNLFAAQLTDSEIADVVRFSHTPFGGKVLKASVAASSQWNSEFRKVCSRINEEAYKRLLADVKPIFDEIAEHRRQPEEHRTE